MPSERRPHRPVIQACRGASLVTVMAILVIVSLLGTVAMDLARLGERSSRNERQSQWAWQGAQAALEDAELELTHASDSPRSSLFSRQASALFTPGCGQQGWGKGLCSTSAGESVPIWLSLDLVRDASHMTELGEFTGRSAQAAAVLPPGFTKPRYLIEAIADPELFADRDPRTAPGVVYRVTAVGFGASHDNAAVIQAIYRTE